MEVLLIEDHPGDARLFEELLDESEVEGGCRWTDSLEAGLEAAREDRPAVIVVDLGLPDSQGPESVRRVDEVLPDTPIVVLTGETGHHTAAASLDAGASEYLRKDGLTPALLSRTLRLAVERRRLEREAQEQRTLSHSILNSLPEHVAVLAPDGTILAVNRAWTEFAEAGGGDPRGYEGENYRAETRRAAEAGSENARTMLEGLRSVLEDEEQHFAFEYPCHGPEQRQWFRVEVTPLQGPERAGVVVSHVDITERKLAELDLEAERSRLREVFDRSPSWVAALRGPDHVYEMVNPAYREMLGDRELIGLPGREAVPEAADQGFFDELDRVYETGEAYRAYERPLDLERPDGSVERIYRNFVYQPRWEDGEVVGVLAHGVDVTEQVETRRELEASERRYRSLFEESPEPIVITTLDGDFVRVNDAFLDLVGYSRDELRQLEVADIYDDPASREEVVDSLMTSGVMQDEYVIRTRDGEPRVVEVVSSLQEDSETDERLIRAIIRDVTQERRLEEELRHRALHDYLTGLANRALFQDRLEHALARAERADRSLALVFLDIDRFKVINDSLGHAAGDRVLKEIASRVTEVVRDQDTVARIGGDEFVLLLEDPGGRPGTETVIDRLLSVLDPPVTVQGKEVPLRVSVGVALVPTEPDAGLPGADEFLDRADRAMFVAKSKPGAAAAWAFELDLEEQEVDAPTSLERERRLRRAIEESRIEPAFQPIVRLGDGRIVGVEALARWRDPKWGSVSPGEFVPLAIETDLIVALGHDILRKACATLSGPETVTEHGDGLLLSVNLSAREVEDPEAASRIGGVLRETGFPRERLQIEVTEQVAMQESESLNRLRDRLGIRVAVDDFGTKHATLAQLKELRLDSLKIDWSFIQGLPDARDDRAIVEAVVTLGHSLGLSVIAEGIETEGQREAVVDLGCRFGQGFLLGRPVGADELRRRLPEVEPGPHEA